VSGSWVWKLVGLLVAIAAVSFVLGYFVVLKFITS
jgi:hypothetical protein